MFYPEGLNSGRNMLINMASHKDVPAACRRRRKLARAADIARLVDFVWKKILRNATEDSRTEKVKRRQDHDVAAQVEAGGERNKSAQIHGNQLKEPRTLEERKMSRWNIVPNNSISAAQIVRDQYKKKAAKRCHLKTA